MSRACPSKAELRNEALARRAGIPAGDHDRLSRLAAGRIAPLIAKAETVALFWPIRGEISPLSLGETICAHGGHVVLPAVVGDAMVFRFFDDAGSLEAGGFGTRHPPAEAPQCLPDLIVAPLAAFDRSGGRIGYGGGYYDRYVSRLRASGHPFRFLGIAFACQEVEKVPLAPHDERLDAVATEREWIVVNPDAVKTRL
jgi:5-formyltetrahydrofolate cyclo-ligase